MPKKPQKCHFLDSRFFESARHVLAKYSGYDKYFSIIIFRDCRRKFRRYLYSRIFELGFQRFLAEFSPTFFRKFSKKILEAKLKKWLYKDLRNFLL